MTTLHRDLQARQCEAATEKTADFFSYLPKQMFAAVARGFETLVVWQRRHDDRVKLAALDEHILKDIGITQQAREAELRKPFWKK